MPPISTVLFSCLISFLVPCYSSSRAAVPTPTEKFSHHINLDSNGKFHLYWKFNATHITFEAHVKTTGYIGFGFSAHGQMFPADVVIGWVKDGRTYFKDRHTVGHFEPVVDASQDWYLLHGEENTFGTVIKTVRKFDTCDANDIKITNDTMRVIYSFNDHEPQSETESVMYHGATNRGAKSVMFLSDIKIPKLPADALTMDFLNNRFLVPNKDTYYHCRIFDLSTLGKKHHMIKFEPIIQKGNEGIVHHMILYKCPNINRKYIGISYGCYETQIKENQPCGSVRLAWAVGGREVYFPDITGLPIGEPGDTDLYILETHYNNPTLHSGFVDNSGFRITYTATLRPQDAGVLMTGALVHPYQVIPPFEKHFVSSGFCTQGCLKKGLDEFPDGVNVFAVQQHGHLLARGIKTRLIRNGTELEPLADDQNYDFDFQDYRTLQQPRKLLSGDSILVECTYDSSQKSAVTYPHPGTLFIYNPFGPPLDQFQRKFPRVFEQARGGNAARDSVSVGNLSAPKARYFTFLNILVCHWQNLEIVIFMYWKLITTTWKRGTGGLATTDEMCLSFMIYYPRMAVGACASAPVYDTINGPNYMYHPNAVKKLFDWSNKTEREEFKNKLQGSKHFVACVGERLPTSNSVEIVPLTKPVTEYNPASSCSKPSTTFKP